MTQEIIEMAEKAGLAFGSDEYPDIWQTYMYVGKKEIEAFAKLVAEKALKDHAMQEVQRLGQEIEQEPVAWQWLGSAHFRKKLPKNADITAWNPLYTHPPQRTWVDLTDEDRNDCLVEADPCECLATPEAQELMRCVEAKLKELNHGK